MILITVLPINNVLTSKSWEQKTYVKGRERNRDKKRERVGERWREGEKEIHGHGWGGVGVKCYHWTNTKMKTMRCKKRKR